MLTFSSQTLSLGNWITRKQEEAAPLAPHPLKMLLSKGKVFLLRAVPASEKPTVEKLQNLSPRLAPPPPHTHTERMAENKERGGRDNNIPFILFEGALIRGGGSDQFTASETFAPFPAPPPPQYFEPWPPNIQNLPTPTCYANTL